MHKTWYFAFKVFILSMTYIRNFAKFWNMHYTSELVEVVLSALSVLATEERGDLVPLWAHLPLINATPVTAPIFVAALPPDVPLDMFLSAAPLPLPPPPHSSRTSPRTSDNLSGTLTNAFKTTGSKAARIFTVSRFRFTVLSLFRKGACLVF